MNDSNNENNKKMDVDPITRDPLLDHNYDGIQELDNPLPGWWLVTFYVAIAFSAFYLIHYHLMDGVLIYKEYARDLLTYEYQKIEASKKPLPTQEELLPFLKDPAQVALGKKIFTQHCLSCHGANGQGGIGPNLTDDYWIQGEGTVAAIAAIVVNGVGDKGMPSWKQVLQHEEVLRVSAFVKTLQGSQPAGAKAPQGELKKRVQE